MGVCLRSMNAKQHTHCDWKGQRMRIRKFGRLVDGTMAICMFGAAAVSFIQLKGVYAKATDFWPLWLMITLVIASIAVWRLGYLGKWLENRVLTEASFWRWAAGLMAVLLALQLATLFAGHFAPRNDLRTICIGARHAVIYGKSYLSLGLPQKHPHYFAEYPNNHLLTCLLILVFGIEKRWTGQITYGPMIGLNVLAIQLSYLLMMLAARVLFGKGKAMMSGVLGLLFTPMVTYATLFYTDTLAMPFLAGAVLSYLVWRQSLQRAKPSHGWLVLAALLLGTGYCMKGSLAVAAVALAIDIALEKMHWRRRWIHLIVFVLILGAAATGVGHFCSHALGISPKESERYRIPTIHWVMMSADGDGGYCAADYRYTAARLGLRNKTRADRARLAVKIKRQGPVHFVEHLRIKFGHTWADSNYLAGYYTRNPIFKTLGFDVASGTAHLTLWLCMALALMGCATRWKTVSEKCLFLRVMLAGLVLFLLVWEARSRYLVSFYILWPLIVASGMSWRPTDKGEGTTNDRNSKHTKNEI